MNKRRVATEGDDGSNRKALQLSEHKNEKNIRAHRHSLSDIVKIKDTQKVVLFLSKQNSTLIQYIAAYNNLQK